MKTAKQTQPDPLYTIFEQHLYHFQDSESDRRTFIGNIVLDYLNYLRKLKIIVPKNMEAAVIEELSLQVNTMLVKKIYGFPSLDEFRKSAMGPLRRRRPRARPAKMKKAG